MQTALHSADLFNPPLRHNIATLLLKYPCYNHGSHLSEDEFIYVMSREPLESCLERCEICWVVFYRYTKKVTRL